GAVTLPFVALLNAFVFAFEKYCRTLVQAGKTSHASFVAQDNERVDPRCPRDPPARRATRASTPSIVAKVEASLGLTPKSRAVGYPSTCTDDDAKTRGVILTFTTILRTSLASADFLRALLHRVGEHPVDSNRSQ